MSTPLLIILLTLYLFSVPDEEPKFLFPSKTYGKDWVAYLNENDTPRYVNLTYSDEEIDIMERDTSVLRGRGEVAFLLYTNFSYIPKELNYPNYEAGNLDPKGFFYFLIPGWLKDHTCDFPTKFIFKIVETWTLKMNVNVIVMDWYSMQNFNYVTAAKRTLEASQFLRYTIEDMSKIYGINGSSIHIIGDDLGAHVAGLAGKQLKRIRNYTIGRISGLDPARAYFEHPKRYEGISKESAAFVDIIHTSANVLGIAEPAGHADFFPNGGSPFQPTCCRRTIVGLRGACEHKCAYTYYHRSFTQKYRAVRCESYRHFNDGNCDMDEVQLMGHPVLNWAQGSYYLNLLLNITRIRHNKHRKP